MMKVVMPLKVEESGATTQKTQKSQTITTDRLLAALVLAIAAIPRLLLATNTGYTFDLSEYVHWGLAMATGSWQQVYSLTDANYPPLLLYFWGAWVKLYLLLTGLLHLPAQPDVTTSRMFSAFSRLPFDVSDLILVYLVWTIARKTVSPRVAAMLAIVFALTPALLLDGPLWGQTDGMAALMLVVAILCAAANKPMLSGLVLGIDVAFKLMPIEFAPLLLVFIWCQAGMWRRQGIRAVVGFCAVMAAVIVITLLPYIVFAPGQLSVLSTRIAHALAGTSASSSAYNLWWLLGVQRVSAATALLGPLTISRTGDLIVACCVLIAAAMIVRSRRTSTLFWGAGLVALAVYMCNSGQHERYLYPAVVAFFFAALYMERGRQRALLLSFYAVAGITMFLNLAMIIAVTRPVGPPKSFLNLTWAHAFLVLHPSVTVLVAAVNVALFCVVATASGCRVFGLLPESGLTSKTQLSPAVAGASYLPTSTTASVAGGATRVSASPSVSLTPKRIAGQEGNHPVLKLRPRKLTRPPIVSVVIPCYNEQGNILTMYERLTAALRQVTPTYEIIFVNNGSSDDSVFVFDDLATRDSRASILNLARNFGNEGAYSAGYAYASGDCVIGISGDLQDPPELLPAFVAKWLDGYDVVYGVRVRRRGSALRRAGFKLYNRLLRRVSYVDIPLDTSDFALMDRRVVEVIDQLPERGRLLRGLRALAGFAQTGISYERDEQAAKRKRNSYRALFRWASLGIFSFSFAPLDVISYLAGAVTVLASVAIVVYSVLYFIIPNVPKGFETLLLAILFLGAVQLLCLSIIGTYLGKIFEEVKARPHFLVREIQNNHRAEMFGDHSARHSS